MSFVVSSSAAPGRSPLLVFGIGRVHKLKFTGRCTSTISLRVQEADVLYVSEERVGNRLVSAEDWGRGAKEDETWGNLSGAEADRQ